MTKSTHHDQHAATKAPGQKPSQDVSQTQVKDSANPQLDVEFEKLQTAFTQAQEAERRAVADYQNLLRRTQEEKLKMAKFAARSLVESILVPFEHLYLAKEQLKDKGLDMVYQQFQQALQSEGVEEIAVLDKEFDPNTMEVVEKQLVSDSKQINKVIKVTQRGYRLNGEVIQPAKVIIGVDKPRVTNIEPPESN